MSERESHMRGLLRLVSPSDKARVKRWIESRRGREKLLKWLSHGTGLDARYGEEPARGERDGERLLRAMQGLSAPRTCYVISSDGHLDDAFCDLRDVLTIELGKFTHGTILSAVPGKLAFFRSAGFSHKHLIVHRPD